MARDFHTTFGKSSWTSTSGLVGAVMAGVIFPIFTLLGQADAAARATGSKIVEIGAAGREEAGALPDLTHELSQRGAAAVSRRDWKKARAAYEEMVAADPRNAPALANLGAVEYQLKDYDAALKHLERAVAEKPSLAQTWLMLGMVHSERGDLLRALSAVSRAVAEKPDDPKAHNHLASVTKALGWPGAAEAELQRALDIDPQYAEAHFNLALTYLERRPPSIEMARRHYLRAVELGAPVDDLVEKQLNDTPSEEISSPETTAAPTPPPKIPSKTTGAPKATTTPKPKSASKPARSRKDD